MRCNNCGKELADDAQFCNGCGAKVEPVAASQTEPTQPGDTTMSKEDYKAAKASYKQARKAAGKSRKPLVIAIVVAFLLVAAAAAGATWYFMSQSQQSAQVASESSSSSSSSGSSSSSSSSSSASSLYDEYVGTWEGPLDSTESGRGSGRDRCYGANGNDMVLTIDSISNDKRIKATAKLVYHGHESTSGSGDKDSMNGDECRTFESLTGTFDSKGFEFTTDANSNEGKLTIKVVPVYATGAYEGVDALEVTVTSVYAYKRPGYDNLKDEVIDTYTLTKKS